MGIFTVRIGIANPQVGEFQWFDALVDTGSIHSMLPATLLEQTLNLVPDEILTFEMAYGRQQRYGYGEALFQVNERLRTCPVIFGAEDQYIMGATTLESFNLIPDTTYRRLIPTPRLRI